MWLYLVHFIARSGSGGVADVLAAVSRTSCLVVGLAGPWLRLLSSSQLCDGGEFTATAAAVASSSVPQLHSLGEFLVRAL
jgi:hypothetical protein